MDPLQIRLPPGIIKGMDMLIEQGFYSNRSQIVRDAVRRMIEVKNKELKEKEVELRKAKKEKREKTRKEKMALLVAIIFTISVGSALIWVISIEGTPAERNLCWSECTLGERMCISGNQTARCIPYKTNCFEWVPYQVCGGDTACVQGFCVIEIDESSLIQEKEVNL